MNRGVEHEDITKHPQYHDYQDHIIEQREQSISDMKLKIRNQQNQIEYLNQEMSKMQSYIHYLENGGKKKNSNQNKILIAVLVTIIVMLSLPYLGGILIAFVK